MGVGKTTVGRLCAQQLGYDFVDADNIIVEREGVSIPVIFEQKGEDYFRQIEAELVHELCLRNDIVIATGGGMIVNTANRHALLRAGACGAGQSSWGPAVYGLAHERDVGRIELAVRESLAEDGKGAQIFVSHGRNTEAATAASKDINQRVTDMVLKADVMDLKG